MDTFTNTFRRYATVYFLHVSHIVLLNCTCWACHWFILIVTSIVRTLMYTQRQGLCTRMGLKRSCNYVSVQMSIHSVDRYQIITKINLPLLYFFYPPFFPIEEHWVGQFCYVINYHLCTQSVSWEPQTVDHATKSKIT